MLGRETWQLPHAKGKWEIVYFKLFHVVPPVYACSELKKVSPTKQIGPHPFLVAQNTLFFTSWKNRAEWTASGFNCKGREDDHSVRPVLSFLGSYDPLLVHLGEGRVRKRCCYPSQDCPPLVPWAKPAQLCREMSSSLGSCAAVWASSVCLFALTVVASSSSVLLESWAQVLSMLCYVFANITVLGIKCCWMTMLLSSLE